MWADFLDAHDAFGQLFVMRIVHDPLLFARVVGYHSAAAVTMVRGWRRRWVLLVLVGLFDHESPSLLFLPHQALLLFVELALELLVVALELTHVVFLLLEKVGVVSLSHFLAERSGLVEGGIHEGAVVGIACAATGAANEIETSVSGFAGVVGTGIAFLDFEAAFEPWPAHGG